MVICLDIHGVCCDFIKGFLSYNEIILPEWPKGEYDVEKVTGHSLKDLSADFWASLPVTEEFEELTNFLNVPGNIIMVATKIRGHAQALGTYAWFLQHFNRVAYIPVQDGFKASCFGDNVILIDDWEEEIRAWSGPSILIPRPWNNATGNVMETVRRRYEEITS